MKNNTQFLEELPPLNYREISTFTLRVYFRNSVNKKGHSFHSWKQEKRKIHGAEVTDQRYAFNRLTWLVEELYSGKYKTAIIYHNTTGEALIQWNYGTIKEKKRFEWITDTGGNIKMKIAEEFNGNPQKLMDNVSEAMNYKY